MGHAGGPAGNAGVPPQIAGMRATDRTSFLKKRIGGEDLRHGSGLDAASVFRRATLVPVPFLAYSN